MMRALLIAVAFALVHAASGAQSQEPVQVIRFTDYRAGAVEGWLREKGFDIEQDAKNRAAIELIPGGNGLTIKTKRRAFGILPNEQVNLSDFTFVEIDWAVNRHPAGASYEKGVRNEAIMVIVFMGDERQPSGSMFIPDSPYFVGLFVCSGDDRTNHPYVGAYFKKSGRYVCVDRPEPGKLVTTRFNLLDAYHAYFDKDRKEDPGISGIALSVDTKKGDQGGVAEALVREIRFYR